MDDILTTTTGAVGTRPAIAATRTARYLALDGHGAPDAFLAYADTLRQITTALDLPLVNPIEALWWAADNAQMTPERMHEWRWTVMLKVPDSFGETELARARARLRGPAGADLLDRVRFDTFDEGPVAQILYVGSLREKAPVLRLLRDFARQQGYDLHGKYHEIYLDDPGPAAVENARTILRLPVVHGAFPA